MLSQENNMTGANLVGTFCTGLHNIRGQTIQRADDAGLAEDFRDSVLINKINFNDHVRFFNM